MYREWSIIGGPLDLTAQDVGQQRTFRVVTNGGKPHDLHLVIDHVGEMFGGAIRSVSGTVTLNNRTVDVIGTYNRRDQTGHLQTSSPDA